MMQEVSFQNAVMNNDFCMVIARLSDATFEAVKECPALVLDKDVLMQLFHEAGPNIHILKGYGNSRGVKPLAKELIAQGAKTISFFRDDLDRVHYLYGRNS